MQQFEDAELRGLAVRLRDIAQRVRVTGFNPAMYKDGYLSELLANDTAVLEAEIRALLDSVQRQKRHLVTGPIRTQCDALIAARPILLGVYRQEAADLSREADRLAEIAKMVEGEGAPSAPIFPPPIATAEASEPTGGEPDDDVADPVTGFVANPANMSEYEPVSRIADRWAASGVEASKVERLLYSPELRWTRPDGHERRRSVNTLDAEAALHAWMERSGRIERKPKQRKRKVRK